MCRYVFFLIPNSLPVLVSTISSCVHIIDCDLVCLRWLLWWLSNARWSHSIGFYFSTLCSFQQTIQLFCQLCWLFNIHGGLFCWNMRLTYVPTSTWLLMWCSTCFFVSDTFCKFLCVKGHRRREIGLSGERRGDFKMATLPCVQKSESPRFQTSGAGWTQIEVSLVAS